MKKEDFTFKSNDQKTQIHGIIYNQTQNTKAVLQIAHGITEHAGRYEELASFLTQNDIAVVAIDLLGHGKSIYDESSKAYFGKEGTWDLVVKDLHKCKEITKQRFKNSKYIMMGFSLGSFLVRDYMIKYGEEGDIDGFILMGTGQKSKLILKMVCALVKKECKKVGEENSSPFIKKLSFETYNKSFAPNKTDYDWLLKSEEGKKNYEDDNLCYKNISAGLFRELLNGMIFTGDIKNIKKINKNTPILLISGKSDSVGDFSKGVKKTQDLFQKVGAKNISVKLYDELRHDILHEDCKVEIYKYLNNWIKENIL